MSADDDWPSEGHVTFNGYATRYRPGLDLVLNDVSVDIKGGEKVDVYSLLLLYRFWWRWLSGERRSLAGGLSLSCARPTADG